MDNQQEQVLDSSREQKHPMHYTRPVFRPALEGDVPLLQVTDGWQDF